MPQERYSPADEMEPSIMTAPKPMQNQKSKTMEINDDTYIPNPDYVQQQYPQQSQESYEEYLPQPQIQENYYPDSSYAPTYDSDIMIEIAEQVFMEKIKKIQKQVDDLTEFKTITEVKLNDSIERLKRIENMIDKLQISILDKVGSYGKNLKNTKKEMDMMQDSFRKIIGSPKENSEEQKKK